MHLLPQFLNQYALLLLPILIMTAWATALIIRRSAFRRWLPWVGVWIVLLAAASYLRTPASTVTSFQPSASETDDLLRLQDRVESLHLIREVRPFTSPEEIRGFLAASRGKPTLVDFYTDFGFG